MTSLPALWTCQQAVRAVAGTGQGSDRSGSDGSSSDRSDWVATGVSIDSRTVTPGDLFVALQGPRFDGHAFVQAALGAGAAAAVVAKRPDGLHADAPLLMVQDTFQALQALAYAARQRASARIAGVTGSVGKTGVKEALRLVLGRQGATHASDGSLNNHWGVPLSLARLPPDAVYGIFEMGMNHAGEIAPLTRQVRPHAAIITTVEAVHIENFASEEDIADAKAEIFAGLEPGGTAVLNRDNRHFDRLARAAAAYGVGRILTFGTADDADATVISADAQSDGSTVRARLCGRPLTFRVGIAGMHWVRNALGLLLVVDALGADAEAAAAALADMQPPKGRGRRTRIRLAAGAFELIDDSYNASPPAMVASLQVVGRCPTGAAGRRIAVLGDMLELGAAAPARHAELAGPLRANGIDLVFTAGPMMAHLHDVLPDAMRGAHAPDSAALAPLAAAAIQPGDVVVVKGSAGSRMRCVVEALVALDVRTQEDPAPVAPAGRAD